MARTRISFVVTEVDGDVIPNASVFVLHRATGEPASVTVNEDGTGGNTNPAITDGAGRIPGWVAEGSYTLVISASTFTTYARAYEALFGASVGFVGEEAATTPKILDGVLTTSHIASDAVITVKIGDAQVTEPKLANDSIATRALVAKAVGSSELAANAIDNVKLQTDSVGQLQIAANAVTAAELADASMTSTELAPSSIATADIADAAVTAAKVGANVVTSSKLADDSVTWTAVHDDFMPIGTVIAMPKPFSDSHWLPCDASLSPVSRVTYAALFAKIGTIYGVGDGSTTFGLPDLRGRMIYGFAVGAHEWIAAMGDTDGLTPSRRSPRHYHHANWNTTPPGGGTHTHSYWSPIVGGNAAIQFGLDGPYYHFPGTTLLITSGAGHTHSASGYTGWNGNLSENPGFQIVHYYMRAL